MTHYILPLVFLMIALVLLFLSFTYDSLVSSEISKSSAIILLLLAKKLFSDTDLVKDIGK
jgi:hypothetical protein